MESNGVRLGARRLGTERRLTFGSPTNTTGNAHRVHDVHESTADRMVAEVDYDRRKKALHGSADQVEDASLCMKNDGSFIDEIG